MSSGESAGEIRMKRGERTERKCKKPTTVSHPENPGIQSIRLRVWTRRTAVPGRARGTTGILASVRMTALDGRGALQVSQVVQISE